MGFEQIPNTPIKPSKEQPPYPGLVLENGIWRKPNDEENIKSIEQDEESGHETDKELSLLEKELKELDDKEYLSPDDLQEKKELEIKYTTLDKQAKETPEEKKKEESKEGEEGKGEKDEEKDKEEGGKEKESKKNEEKEKLEKELIENYNDELEKIKKMPDDNKNLKAKKYLELINDWKDMAYLDDYKGIQETFSELNKSKPSILLFNYKKAETIDEIARAMASNYKEWDLEDKEKLKIIKNFVKKQSKEKNFWYRPDDKDETLKDISKILASQDIPFKGSIDSIVKDIENPNIKSETISEILKIEKETIEEKKELLKEMKEEIETGKMPPEEKIKEQLGKMGVSENIMKILENPEALSKIFYEASEISKDPEVQEKFQELKNAIEKIIKKKEEVPPVLKNAKDFIQKGAGEKDKDDKEKKESSWKTAFETMGWSILLFLVLFMLAELKGVDYLSEQATGKKKEKK